MKVPSHDNILQIAEKLLDDIQSCAWTLQAIGVVDFIYTFWITF